MLSVCNLKHNKTNLFKTVQVWFQNPRQPLGMKRQVIKIIFNAEYDEISDLRNLTALAVPRFSTLRRLRQLRYNSRILILRPLLLIKRKQNRSIRARDQQNWSVDQWNKVIFSDESRFCISFDYRGPHRSYAKCVKNKTL